MSGLLDFLSAEAGQRRTRARDEAIENVFSWLLGPTGIPDRLNAIGLLNPVQDIYEAGGNARDGDYTGAAINTASALMPVVGAKLAGGGLADDAANIISDTLTNVGTRAQGAMDAGQAFAADEFGGVGIPEKAKEAAKLIRERYGVEPEFSFHPTSWGNSAYVNVRLPGPDRTYLDTGFRLSDHDTGDFRKATDGIPTIIDSDEVTSQSLFESIATAYDSADPELKAKAAARTRDAGLNVRALDAWRAAGEATKSSAAAAYKESPKGRAGRPWRNLKPEEKARFAFDSGLIGR